MSKQFTLTQWFSLDETIPTTASDVINGDLVVFRFQQAQFRKESNVIQAIYTQVDVTENKEGKDE